MPRYSSQAPPNKLCCGSAPETMPMQTTTQLDWHYLCNTHSVARKPCRVCSCMNTRKAPPMLRANEAR